MMKYYFLVLTALVLCACSPKQAPKQSLQGSAFGTTYGIQYFGQEVNGLQSQIDSVIDGVNGSMSTYIPDSDISRINQGDSLLQVDAMFKEVYRISETVHDQSKGYFDPTIGVLRNAYGFGTERPLEVIDSLTIDSLMQYVGFDKVSMDDQNRILKTHPNIYFDFNAVAKGYGIDRIALLLDSHDIQNYLIELGGELVGKGINTEKDKPWVVGIEAIDSPLGNRAYQATVALTDAAMASSGNYRKYRVDSLTGQRFVHTINPLTGDAQASNLTSATVIAPSCAWADAYATTFMAMGLQGSIELLEDLDGVEAYLTYTQGPEDKVFVSPGFELLLQRSAANRE